MKRAIIQAEKCLNCKDCEPMRQCGMNAIFKESPEDKPWIDFYKCSGCLNCKPLCSGRAIKLIVQPCSTHGKTTW
jgi:MinD superfamily P-loop ATPase